MSGGDQVAEFVAEVVLASLLIACGDYESAEDCKSRAQKLYDDNGAGDIREHMQIALEGDLPAVLGAIVEAATWRPPFADWDESISIQLEKAFN